MIFITKEVLNQNIIPTAPHAKTDQDIKWPLIRANVRITTFLAETVIVTIHPMCQIAVIRAIMIWHSLDQRMLPSFYKFSLHWPFGYLREGELLCEVIVFSSTYAGLGIAIHYTGFSIARTKSLIGVNQMGF